MRQDVFSVAYQEAKSELLDITCKFEQLRQRKERLEGVVAVLGPLLGQAVPTQAVVEVRPMPALEPAAEPEPTYTFNQISPVAEAVEEEETTDPFQKRLRDALKFSTPHREGLLNAI